MSYDFKICPKCQRETFDPVRRACTNPTCGEIIFTKAASMGFTQPSRDLLMLDDLFGETKAKSQTEFEITFEPQVTPKLTDMISDVDMRKVKRVKDAASKNLAYLRRKGLIK